MQIIVASSAFKESISAKKAVNALAKGIKKASPKARLIKIPVADGGEDTLEVLSDALKAKIIKLKTKGPLSKTVQSKIALTKDKTAIIEMAQSSGIHLIKASQRNPLLAHTFGTGQMILHALNKGAKKIIIGIGGSATIDAGVGMAMALGYRFLDKKGKSIGLGAENIEKLYRIDKSKADKRIFTTDIFVACDVANPLLGPRGASKSFGPQKGATPKMVKQIEQNLIHFVEIVKKNLDKDVSIMKHGGSSGGLGAGLHAFCNGKLFPGAELVLDIIGFIKHLENTNLIIVGEGEMDNTSFYGKAPIAISRIAKKHKIPVHAVCGKLKAMPKTLRSAGIEKVIQLITYAKSPEDSIRNTDKLLEKAVRKLIKL